MSTQAKYNEAIRTLQRIATTVGASKSGAVNDMSQAIAFRECKQMAARTLNALGEPIIPNKPVQW